MKSSCHRKFDINSCKYPSTDNGQRTPDIQTDGGDRAKDPAQFIARRVLILACIGIIAFNFSAAAADAPKRIALLPFKINSDKDLSFLQDGIFDMLTTRLSREGQVDVIGRTQTEEAIQAAAPPSGTINESVARSIGTRLNADFVLFGSLTVLGNNVSIDAKMVDVSGGRPTMTFFDQGQDLGAVITKINLIAADINEKVFGETRVAAAAAETPGAVKKSPPVPQSSAPQSDIYAHPEKVLKEDGFVAHEKTENLETQSFLKGTAQETQSRFWKSANFKHLIYGVTLGDVDGDGKIETAIATPHSVIIFRSESGAFRKIAEIEESSSKNLIGIDCADINENGIAEIFVTSLNAERTVVSSYVLEYDGSNFVKIVSATPYYFRVTITPHRGKILLGQRPRTGKPSAGGIFEMKWQNGEYVPSDPINVPIDTNLLGLTIGDAENNGQEVAVAYKDGDYILLIDSAGNTVWDNRERFGGSMLYASVPWDYRGQVENKWYYPLRLVVWYNKAKKENVVIAVQNHDLTGARTDQFRYFTKTHIAGFTWDGVGLGPVWQTRELTGYIQDFVAGDFDNDGQDELVAALITKEGRFTLASDPRSTIIAYELNASQ